MQTPADAEDDAGFDRVRDYLTGLQDRICAAIEGADGAARFREDLWSREEGGGGRTRILREGAVFEQAGIGFSDVSGSKLPPSATAARPELAGARRPSANANASSSCTAAGATSNSTWSTTAARCSGCRAAGGPSRS